jgi:nucleoside 2-deoxyribosyltransferase
MFREGRLAFLALPANAPKDLASSMKAVLESHGLQAFQPSDLDAGTNLVDSIQSALRESDVVIADITGKNSNVLFEVGLAIGLRKPVLLLSQGPLDELPSDLRAYQVASYSPDDSSTVSRYLALWLRDVLTQKSSSVAY